MLRTVALGSLVLVFGAALGCGDDDSSTLPDATDATVDTTPPEPAETFLMPDAPPLDGETECRIRLFNDPGEGSNHVDVCSELTYPYHPPAVGPHYSRWANFRTYDAPVPWPFLVHSMEHGAVIFAYRCDETECPEVHAAMDAISAGIDDPKCRDFDDVESRFIKVPDPTLDTPFVLTAWENTYEATCLDQESAQAFVDTHYAQAPEDFCSPGVDLADQDWCEGFPMDAGVEDAGADAGDADAGDAGVPDASPDAGDAGTDADAS